MVILSYASTLPAVTVLYRVRYLDNVSIRPNDSIVRYITSEMRVLIVIY